MLYLYNYIMNNLKIDCFHSGLSIAIERNRAYGANDNEKILDIYQIKL